MVSEPDKSTEMISPGRLWAEQLAMGMGLFIALLVFMAMFHPAQLSTAGQVLTTGDLAAYGWFSVLGIALHFVFHEAGSLAMAWHFKLPLRFRLFPFGVNAAATLSPEPRRVWIDAAVGIAGPLTGTVVSVTMAVIYQCTGNPYFLGMACVGYFYNLFTLIPILDLEGGWIAPAVALQAWLIGTFAAVIELRHGFNLVLLGFVSFAVPRILLILRARMPREDLVCTPSQRLILAAVYFILVLGLAWFGTTTFGALAHLVPEAMGD